MINISLYLYDIDKKVNVCPIIEGSSIDPAIIPIHATVIGVPSSSISSMRFQYETINKLEGSAPYSLNGDNVPVAFPVGDHSIKYSIYGNKQGNSPPIQTPTVINFKVSKIVQMGYKGLDGATIDTVGLSNMSSMISTTKTQCCRVYIDQSYRLGDLPVLGQDVLDTMNWFGTHYPGHPFWLTFARERGSGKLQQQTPPSANLLRWGKALAPQLIPFYDKYGPDFVTVGIGNESYNVDNFRYWLPLTPRPAGWTDAEWCIQTYIRDIQAPLNDTLKQASGGRIRTAGFGTVGPADFEYAMSVGYGCCDYGDLHLYPNNPLDLTSAIKRVVTAFKSNKVVMSEWGFSHSETTSHQSKHMDDFVGQGCPGFELLYAHYYYRSLWQGITNDPGLWGTNGLVPPISNSFQKISGRI